MYYKVYVIYSPSHNKLIAGMTTSLGDTLRSLNGEYPEKDMSGFKPWTLVHIELFDDEVEASLREAYLESSRGQAYVRSDILALYGY